MVRVFVYDADIEEGKIPSDIIEYPQFDGKRFHYLTHFDMVLYEGLSLRLVFEENASGEFRPFAVVTIEFKNQKFSRKLERIAN